MNLFFRAIPLHCPNAVADDPYTCRSFFKFWCQSSLHQSPIRIKIMPDDRRCSKQVVHSKETLHAARFKLSRGGQWLLLLWTTS
jgi:hypothetical protein